MTEMIQKTKNKILVIVAHADDETIGCGGTLLKHRDAGDEIKIIFMTDGVGARTSPLKPNDVANSKVTKEVEHRLRCQKMVCGILKVSQYYNYDFPDNRMDQVALIDVAQKIEPILSAYRPTIIYTHHGGDLNVDHRIVHQATITACRPQPNSPIKTILTFEVNSSSEWSSASIGDNFTPNYFVDISQHQEKKQQLLHHYQGEMQPFPHSRSTEAIRYLNNTRGSHIGVESAEAFMLIRKLA